MPDPPRQLLANAFLEFATANRKTLLSFARTLTGNSLRAEFLLDDTIDRVYTSVLRNPPKDYNYHGYLVASIRANWYWQVREGISGAATTCPCEELEAVVLSPTSDLYDSMSALAIIIDQWVQATISNQVAVSCWQLATYPAPGDTQPYNCREVAQIMGVSHSLVRYHVTCIRKKVRQEFTREKNELLRELEEME
jgi:DNA-directed RNA polymerase specialized sigma24 family protein